MKIRFHIDIDTWWKRLLFVAEGILVFFSIGRIFNFPYVWDESMPVHLVLLGLTCNSLFLLFCIATVLLVLALLYTLYDVIYEKVFNREHKIVSIIIAIFIYAVIFFQGFILYFLHIGGNPNVPLIVNIAGADIVMLFGEAIVYFFILLFIKIIKWIIIGEKK